MNITLNCIETLVRPRFGTISPFYNIIEIKYVLIQ